MFQACLNVLLRLAVLALGVFFLTHAVRELDEGNHGAFKHDALIGLILLVLPALPLLCDVFFLPNESQERKIWKLTSARKHSTAGRRAPLKSSKPVQDGPYAAAIASAADSGPRVLSRAETENAQRLIGEGTVDATTLAVSALRSCTPADIAAVFTPAIIKSVVSQDFPCCLPHVAHAVVRVKPCFRFLLAAVIERINDDSEADFEDPGSPMCRLVPARQQLYRVLLEGNFPPRFVGRLKPLPGRLTRYVWNPNMWGSWYEWAFTGESLQTLSPAGATLLANLPVVVPEEHSPMYGNHKYDLGRFIILTGLTTLADEVASALSGSRRDLVFGSLQSFPDTPGHVQLARRLARQERVFLAPRTAVIAPAIAQILASKL